MTTFGYIIFGLIIILSGLYLKIRRHLNFISRSFSVDKTIRNKLEVVMQPKWYLNSVYLIALMWLFLIYYMIKNTGWWSVLIIIGSYLSLSLVVRIIIIPTKRQLTNYFYSVVLKRLAHNQKYNQEELIYLNASKNILQELLKT